MGQNFEELEARPGLRDSQISAGLKGLTDPPPSTENCGVPGPVSNLRTPSEAAGLDREFAATIRERCSSDDLEINGCELDRIMLDLTHRLGMTETVEAFNAVDCWRA